MGWRGGRSERASKEDGSRTTEGVSLSLFFDHETSHHHLKEQQGWSTAVKAAALRISTWTAVAASLLLSTHPPVPLSSSPTSLLTNLPSAQWPCLLCNATVPGPSCGPFVCTRRLRSRPFVLVPRWEAASVVQVHREDVLGSQGANNDSL